MFEGKKCNCGKQAYAVYTEYKFYNKEEVVTYYCWQCDPNGELATRKRILGIIDSRWNPPKGKRLTKEEVMWSIKEELKWY